MIHNPNYVPPDLKTWMGLWRHLKENNLNKEVTVRLKWHDPISPLYTSYDSVQVHEVSYDTSFVKLKAFDEIENKEPEDWDIDTVHQAFGCYIHIRDMFRADKLSEWLVRTAQKEMERIYNDSRQR